MISFIICSINPNAAQAVLNNIRDTIGNTVFESIVFDNRTAHKGIAEVYNSCATKAKHEFLCFVHEDFVFHTCNWGKHIEEQLKKKDCGIIGFTGSCVKTQTISPVHHYHNFTIHNYIQYHKKDRRLFMNTQETFGGFVPCITVDGMCMFVRKGIWEQNKFDENLIKGFHGYDLDFSLQVARNYRNFICNNVIAEHLSCGSFSADWVKTLIDLHEKKWNKELPMAVDGIPEKDLMEAEHEALFIFIKKALRTEYPFSKLWKHIHRYWSMTHLKKHSATLLLKIIGNRGFHIKV
jgi:hypothetical protein